MLTLCAEFVHELFYDLFHLGDRPKTDTVTSRSITLFIHAFITNYEHMYIFFLDTFDRFYNYEYIYDKNLYLTSGKIFII